MFGGRVQLMNFLAQFAHTLIHYTFDLAECTTLAIWVCTDSTFPSLTLATT